MITLNTSKKFCRWWLLFSIVLFCAASISTLTYISASSPAVSLLKKARYLSYALLFIGGTWNLVNEWLQSKTSFLKAAVNFFISHLFLWISLLLCTIVSLNSGSKLPLVLCIAFYGSRGLPQKLLLKVLLACMVISLAVIVIGSQTGLFPNLIFLRSDGSYRYALGFVHPLEAQYFLVFILLLGCCLCRKYMLIYTIAALALLFAGYLLTDSKTATFIGAAALAAALIVWVLKEKLLWVWKNRVCWYLILALTTSFFFVPVALCESFSWNKPVLVAMDRFVNLRISLGKWGLQQHPVKLFGREVSWVGEGEVDGTVEFEDGFVKTFREDYNFVDCSYVKTLIDYGPVFLVWVYLGYLYILSSMYQARNLKGIILVLSILAFSMMDARLLEIAMNPFLFFMGPWLFLSNKAWLKETGQLLYPKKMSA